MGIGRALKTVSYTGVAATGGYAIGTITDDIYRIIPTVAPGMDTARKIGYIVLLAVVAAVVLPAFQRVIS